MTQAPAPQPQPSALPAAEVARALDAMLAELLDLLWSRLLYIRLLGPLAGPVWTRIARTRERLARALAHVAAGRAPRPARPRPARPLPARQPLASPLPASPAPAGSATPGPDTPPAPPRPRDPVPRRRFGWLGRALDHHIRARAAHLQHLLARPGVAETIAASPGARRTLRPLCRMLGAELPPLLRPPPPAARPPAARAPAARAHGARKPPAAERPPKLTDPGLGLPRWVIAAARASHRRFGR